MCLLFLVLWMQFWCLRAENSTGLADGIVERSRRGFDAKYLVFPEGSNVQLVYCMTISTYTKPSGLFTIGLTAGQAWELPSKSTLSDQLEDYHRRSRRQLYRKLELLLGSRGMDGRACVLKAICRATARNRPEIGRGSFLEEILHAVFTLPGSSGDPYPMTDYEKAYFLRENCEEASRKCPDMF